MLESTIFNPSKNMDGVYLAIKEQNRSDVTGELYILKHYMQPEAFGGFLLHLFEMYLGFLSATPEKNRDFIRAFFIWILDQPDLESSLWLKQQRSGTVSKDSITQRTLLMAVVVFGDLNLFNKLIDRAHSALGSFKSKQFQDFIFSQNLKGNTALDIAHQYGHGDIEKRLSQIELLAFQSASPGVAEENNSDNKELKFRPALKKRKKPASSPTQEQDHKHRSNQPIPEHKHYAELLHTGFEKAPKRKKEIQLNRQINTTKNTPIQHPKKFLITTATLSRYLNKPFKNFEKFLSPLPLLEQINGLQYMLILIAKHGELDQFRHIDPLFYAFVRCINSWVETNSIHYAYMNRYISTVLYQMGKLAKHLTTGIETAHINILLFELRKNILNQPRDIANALYGVGLLVSRNKLTGSPINAGTINSLLHRLSKQITANPQNIGNVLYGVGFLAETIRLSDSLIRADTINDLLLMLSQHRSAKPLNIAHALYGVSLLAREKKISLTDTLINAGTINTLLLKLSQGATDADSQEIANALYGIGLLARRSRLSDTQINANSINILLLTLLQQTDILPLSITYALYGIGLLAQKISSVDITVNTGSISALLRKLSQHTDLSPRRIANALYAVGLLAKENRLTDSLINADTINILLLKLSQRLDIIAIDIAQTLYGTGLLAKENKLTSLLINTDIINSLLRKLSQQTVIKPKEIANVLYGAGLLAKKNKLTDIPINLDIINALSLKLSQQTDTLSQDIANVLYSLGLLAKGNKLTDSAINVEIINVLLSKLLQQIAVAPLEIANASYGIGKLIHCEMLILNSTLKNTLERLIFQVKSEKLTPSIFCQMLGYFHDTQQFATSKKFFYEKINLLEQNDSNIHNVFQFMIRIFLQHLSFNDISNILQIMRSLNKDILPIEKLSADEIHQRLSKNLYLTHLLLEKLRYGKQAKKIRKTTDTIKQIEALATRTAKKLREQLSLKAVNLSARDAWLLTTYFPNETFIPDFKSEEKISSRSLIPVSEIKKAAFDSLDHDLKPIELNQPALSVHEVSPKGEYLGEYSINSSVYAALTNNAFPPYIVVPVHHPKPGNMPLYIRYQGTLYRTDVICGFNYAGTRSDSSRINLIGIPQAAVDFFQTWFPTRESAAYGKRMFLPETRDMKNHVLNGKFNIAVVPDNKPIAIMNNLLTVYDGTGLIAAKEAEKLDIRSKSDKKDIREKSGLAFSGLAFQALQHYSTKRSPRLAEALVAFGEKMLTQLARDLKENGYIIPAPDFATKTYAAFSCKLPTLSGVGIPVNGDKVILPEKAQTIISPDTRVAVGKNPYDSGKLHLADVDFKPHFNDLKALQYSLTGYIINNEEQEITGVALKGLFVVVPKEHWPKEYPDAHIIVRRTEFKITTEAEDISGLPSPPETKTPTTGVKSKEEIELTVHGMLVVKQQIETLIGIPLKLAEKEAGDFDGDIYEILCLINGLLLAMCEALDAYQKESHPPLGKLPKSKTPRTGVGNLDKLMQMCTPLLAQWSTLSTVLFNLPMQGRLKIAQEARKDCMLATLIGEDRARSYTSLTDPVVLLMIEIQAGLRFAQDLPKRQLTNEQYQVLKERVQQLLKLFSHYCPSLSVPFGKGLLKRLEKLGKQDKITLEQLRRALTPGSNIAEQKEKKSDSNNEDSNVVKHTYHQLLARSGVFKPESSQSVSKPPAGIETSITTSKSDLSKLSSTPTPT